MKHLLLTTACAVAFSTSVSMAQDMDHSHHMHHGHHMAMTGDSHANHGVRLTPNGITGDHLHEKGQWMLSYSFMRMEMDGNRDGTNDLSDADILTYANIHGAPANLRVVPQNMTMDMHMFGGMVGIGHDITLMAMVPYLKNDMDHNTYNMGGTYIGSFNTESSGLGDISLSALFPLYKNGAHQLNGRLGLSLPTGSIDEEDDVLTPMNTTPTLRLPYAMQLGSGTYDILPALTYTTNYNDWSFGAGYQGRIHLGENSEDYTRGDKHDLTAWAGYRFTNAFGVTANIKAETEGKIDGQDANITAPVQTADPSNYGGDTVSFGVQAGWRFYDKTTIKGSFALPLYQDLNGPQMKDDYQFGLRLEKAF